MAVCEIHMGAQNALWKMTSAMVIIPETGPGPFPVLYLLHGLSDDHTGWVRRTSLERHVRDLPLMVVMPDGGRGWYTDSAANPMAAHETAIVRDLIAFIDGAFRTIASRSGRVIGGLSMGGYGAFKLALKHPDLFCGAFSHSGALVLDVMRNPDPQRQAELRLIFGDHLEDGPEGLTTIVETAERRTLPALRMDCGVDDGLLEANRTFHAKLQDLRVQHEYVEYPGGHSWDYWDKSIVEALPFVTGALGIP